MVGRGRGVAGLAARAGRERHRRLCGPGARRLVCGCRGPGREQLVPLRQPRCAAQSSAQGAAKGSGRRAARVARGHARRGRGRGALLRLRARLLVGGRWRRDQARPAGGGVAARGAVVGAGRRQRRRRRQAGSRQRERSHFGGQRDPRRGAAGVARPAAASSRLSLSSLSHRAGRCPRHAKRRRCADHHSRHYGGRHGQGGVEAPPRRGAAAHPGPSGASLAAPSSAAAAATCEAAPVRGCRPCRRRARRCATRRHTARQGAAGQIRPGAGEGPEPADGGGGAALGRGEAGGHLRAADGRDGGGLRRGRRRGVRGALKGGGGQGGGARGAAAADQGPGAQGGGGGRGGGGGGGHGCRGEHRQGRGLSRCCPRRGVGQGRESSRRSRGSPAGARCGAGFAPLRRAASGEVCAAGVSPRVAERRRSVR
mmetsp:Transcript_23248/g.75940  ORF Transcript_23248/g.75940 Transcript_23248/m.75940 type:complete len:426 (+) Transcript_23248:1145-2422(+)